MRTMLRASFLFYILMSLLIVVILSPLLVFGALPVSLINLWCSFSNFTLALTFYICFLRSCQSIASCIYSIMCSLMSALNSMYWFFPNRYLVVNKLAWFSERTRVSSKIESITSSVRSTVPWESGLWWELKFSKNYFTLDYLSSFTLIFSVAFFLRSPLAIVLSLAIARIDRSPPVAFPVPSSSEE
jgi:hypothetical protein